MIKILPVIFLTISLHCFGQRANEEKEVLDVVTSFFTYFEKQDTLALMKIFMKESHDYYVREDGGKVISGGRSSLFFKFSADQVMKEKLRGSPEVNIHNRLATVWAPYDFWVNDKIHHCGVDAFTLIKTREGWKIASIGFTVENDKCAAK